MTLNATREAVLSALFTKLSSVTFASAVAGNTTFKNTSRRLKVWSDVPRDQRPALFMTCHNETPAYKSENSPPYVKLSVRLFIYIDSQADTSPVPDQDLNVILDAIDKALDPQPLSPKQTLGGLVSHCRIDGEVLRDPGDLDGDGLLVIPIDISLT